MDAQHHEDQPRPVKQVIIVRKDLNMRKGKMVAQGSHAAIKHLWGLFCSGRSLASLTECERIWYTNKWRKICVSVDSEAALLDIFDKAQAAGLPVFVVEDEGLTEFNGVKTLTCLAIGPAFDEQVNMITGHLPLL